MIAAALLPTAGRSHRTTTSWRRIAKPAWVIVVGSLAVWALVSNAHIITLAMRSVLHANPAWLALTIGLGATPDVGAGMAIRAACGHDLPIGRTTTAQLAAACANRIAPAGLGAMATNLRYLQHEGVERDDAVAAIASTSVASLVVHVVLTAVMLGSTGLASGVLPAPVDVTLVAPTIVVVTAVVIGLARYLPGRARASVRAVIHGLQVLAASPGRLGRLALGTLAVTLGHAFAFATATAALGIQLPTPHLLAVFLTGSAVAAAAPVPSGLGPTEAALAAGLTGLGAPAAPAVAAVLAFRLVTYWLPALPGAIALRVLWNDPSGAASPRWRVARPNPPRVPSAYGCAAAGT